MSSAVTITGAAQQAGQTADQRLNLAEDFTDFLTLLTTQLQHQDPLAPMDTTEFTNQLVAFTGVEQQINTNQKLDNLVQLQLGSIASVALGFVGLDASYLSNEMNWDGSSPVTVTYAFGSEVSSNKINILDEDGKVVFSADGATSSGKNEFVWNGLKSNGQPAEPGTYEVSIDAVGADGKPASSTVIVSGRVRGIETQDGIVYLLIGERAVSLSNIINASVPPAPTTTPTTTDTEDNA